MPKQVALTSAQARMLFMIGKLERKTPPEPATVQSMAAELGITENTVRKIIAGIKRARKTYLHIFPLPKRKDSMELGGRPQLAYRLHEKHCVTFPVSAKMLLRLTEIPTIGKPYLINRNDFVAQFAAETGESPDFIRERLDANRNFFSESAGGHFSVNYLKFEDDRPFLELLATDYCPPVEQVTQQNNEKTTVK